MRRNTSALRVDDVSFPEFAAPGAANISKQPAGPASALIAAVSGLTDAELAQLEDELDFYIFARFAGPLLAGLIPLTEG